MAAKKKATVSVSALEQEIEKVSAKLDQARQKQVKEAQKAADQAKKSVATATKKLTSLRRKKIAAGKVKAKTPASQKRLQSAIESLAAQQAEVELARQMLDSAKKALAEIQTVQKAAQLRAREIDKNTKAVSKTLRKKTSASKPKRTKKVAAKKTSTNVTSPARPMVTNPVVTNSVLTNSVLKSSDLPKPHAADHGTTSMIEPRETKLPRPEPVSDTPASSSLFDTDFYESDDKF